MAMRQAVAAGAFAAAALVLAVVVPAMAGESEMQRTVTVTATGEVGADPDMARVTSGVISEATTAREALDRNSATMQKVIAGLKSTGIEAKDIQTTSFHVEPRYTQPRDGQVAVINGYRVVNQLDIRIRDLSRLGELLDQLIVLGANQMGGLSFEVSRAETLNDEARQAAIANARRRAELYAAAAGARVGDVIAISEDTSFSGPRPFAMARKAMADAVPVEAGTQALEARVTVVWSLAAAP
ncbi:MAG: SIMPL domain-containing protein [Hyphomicrobium sp.]